MYVFLKKNSLYLKCYIKLNREFLRVFNRFFCFIVLLINNKTTVKLLLVYFKEITSFEY